MVSRNFKDLPRRTASDKVLCNKAFNIDKNPKYDEYRSSFASMVYRFFDKKSSGGEFYNSSLKSSLKSSYIEMYSINNGGKSVVFERFNWTIENKFYKYMMTPVSKHVYTDKLDGIVNE